MKYHALFVIFEKAAKFEIVLCCKFLVAFYGLNGKSKDQKILESDKYLVTQSIYPSFPKYMFIVYLKLQSL